MAVSGNTTVVGAYYADSGGTDCGQAYIFTFYSAPTFTGIAPATGTNNDGAAAVTITGTNYYGTPVVKLKKTGETDIAATGVTLTGDTTIGCTFDLTGATTGAWDVEITNPDAQVITGAGAFTVTIPVPVVTHTTYPNTASNGGSDSSDSGLGNSTEQGEKQQLALPKEHMQVNVGGNSAIIRTSVTGTGLSGFIVTGTKQSDPGAGISPPSGTVFQYVELVPAQYTSIMETTITFTVPKSWLGEHGLNPQEIVLYHYTGTGWDALPTTPGTITNGFVTFSATSPGFSLFAIGTVPVAGGSTTASPTIATIGELAGLSHNDTLAPALSALQAPAVTTTAPAIASQPQAGFPIPGVVFVVAGVMIVAGGGLLVRRWWIRRQNPALFREID